VGLHRNHLHGAPSSECRRSKCRIARKTKRPRLNLSHGTLVDQPSPKCCSIRRLT
jgi:hypothetical protein